MKLKELLSESGQDESNIEDSSLDEPSSDDDHLEVDNKRGDNNTHEGLGVGDQDGGLQLGVEDRIFRLVCKDDAGSYLRGMKGCGSSAIEKQERRQNRGLEKSASQTSLTVEMFTTHCIKNRSHDEYVTTDAALVPPRLRPQKEGYKRQRRYWKANSSCAQFR